jgi:hypothetical protein
MVPVRSQVETSFRVQKDSAILSQMRLLWLHANCVNESVEGIGCGAKRSFSVQVFALSAFIVTLPKSTVVSADMLAT